MQEILDRPLPRQLQYAWTAVGALLNKVNAAYPDFMECTTCHIGLQHQLATLMAIRDEYLSEPWPSWTAIEILELNIEGAQFEIRVTARLCQ